MSGAGIRTDIRCGGLQTREPLSALPRLLLPAGGDGIAGSVQQGAQPGADHTDPFSGDIRAAALVSYNTVRIDIVLEEEKTAALDNQIRKLMVCERS